MWLSSEQFWAELFSADQQSWCWSVLIHPDCRHSGQNWSVLSRTAQRWSALIRTCGAERSTGALHSIIQVIPNYPLMSCICFSANMSISANKPLFGAQQQYFCLCICFSHKKALQIIPNISCVLFTFSGIGSSCVHMLEIDGLGQPTLDDLWELMLLHNKCKQL